MEKKTSKALNFLRRNALYIVLALCILAVGLSIALMQTNQGENLGNVDDIPTITDPNEDEKDNNEPNDDPNDQPNEDDKPTVEQPVDVPVEFISPVLDPTAITDYSEQMVFNSTLNRYSAHKAIDFFAPEGTEVLAVYDGTVLSVENTLLMGTTIVIDHGDGLKSIYNSLEDGELVTVGQKVKKGDVIGAVSSSNKQEYKSGAHLHFEVIENDKVIDPVKYLNLDLK